MLQMLTRFFPLILTVAVATATERPILGILAQEWRSYYYGNFGTSYIPSAYVKAVEASGARVVPIFINMTEEYYEDILRKVNGVVLPGGSVNLLERQGHAEAGKYLYNIAKRMNLDGDYFPILGVCQGYELLMFLANDGNTGILTKCECFEALNLNFKEDFRNSTLYKDAPEDIITTLQTLPVTSNHHRFCITEDSLKKLSLDKEWKVLSTNTEKNGIEFISSSESTHFPFVGVQFHPEKNAYEWNINQTFNPHYPEAIQSGRYFYDWIVKEARKNNHSFTSLEEEYDNLIYNYNPVYLGKRNAYIEQAYFFNSTADFDRMMNLYYKFK